MPMTSAARSIIERLEAIGIRVPDQPKAHRMMEAARLDLSPHAPEWRIKIAWIRRRQKKIWQIFTWKKFIGGSGRNWGGYPPRVVQKQIAQIQLLLPSASLKVYAKHDDPFFLVDDVIVFAWQRSTRHMLTVEIDLT